VNETVERRNFRRHTQQVGESFDDFFVSLRELVKKCNFCSDACTQKNIRDQIIEGLLDDDTVEDLLQETDLRLYTSVRHRRLQRNIGLHYTVPLRLLQHLRSLHPTIAAPHPGGQTQCPAYSQICFNCQKIGHLAKV